MLRSPLEAVGANRWAALATVTALAAMLWLAAALWASAAQLQGMGAAWWERFVPVVYLQAGVDPEAVEELRVEMSGWPLVERVEVEGPEAALTRLEQRLGVEEVRRLGVDQTMMPTALVVRARVWRPDQAELMSRVKALEVREEVVGVDAPQAGALKWLNWGRGVALGVGLAVVLGLVGTLGGVASFLRRLQEEERRENHLLEVFGASVAVLKRASIWRGMALGLVAGAVAAAGFLPWMLLLVEFLGQVAGERESGAVMAAAGSGGLLVSGVVLGGGAGWLSTWRRSSSVEGLLQWEWERGRR